MSARLTQVLLGLSLLLNLFVLTGFVYRGWIAPPVVADTRPTTPPGGRPPGPLDMLAHELNLDEGQRQALRDVFEQNSSTRRDRQREFQKLREQMLAELQRPTPDVSKLDAIVEQVTKLRGEQQKESLHVMLQIAPKLRPEQRERFQTLLAERFGGIWQRPGGPGQRGPGGPGQNRPPQ